IYILQLTTSLPCPSGSNSSAHSSVLNSDTTVKIANDIKSSFVRHDSSRRIIDSTTDERIFDTTEDIDMNSMNGDEDFFEGLRIFLLGVPSIRESWWKKMLNWSGATRVMRTEMATHIVVVGGSIEKTIRNCGKPVLTTEWVITCM
ncbi:hypothetical protein PMAYCL1PPCAC_10135, partial [Pristionchus mayeri]